jgi:hypothetical protein
MLLVQLSRLLVPHPQLPATQNYTFDISCDDHCGFFVDGQRLLQGQYRSPGTVTLMLPAGQHQIMVILKVRESAPKPAVFWGA